MSNGGLDSEKSRYQLVQEDAELATIHDLNNFVLKRSTLQRIVAVEEEQQSVRDQLQAGGFPMERFGYSEKYLSGTSSDFLQAIEHAIDEAKIDKAELDQSIHLYESLARVVDFSNINSPEEQKKMNERWRFYGEINTLLLPVYRILRKQGYNHQELTS